MNFKPGQIKRFWGFVKKTERGCWNWAGGFFQGYGYGRFYFNGISMQAHRMSFYLANGFLPKGNEYQVIRHSCDNPKCVNPSHLVIGSPSDNVSDRVKRKRGAVGSRVNTSKLSEEQVLEIKNIYKKGRRGFGHKAIADKYGVTAAAIRFIIIGKNWKHLL